MKKPQLILLLIFLAVLALRLYFAFTIPNFTHESYFHLRHIEHIAQTGLPLYHDHLSYGGRTLIFLPFFHYFFAFFSLILPLEFAAKLLANLLLVSLIPLAYLIAKKLTSREDSALLSAFTAAFIPLLWSANSLSPLQLFFPLLLLAIYSFMNLQEKRFVYLYLGSVLLLSLTSSATFLFITGLFLYLLLSKIEEKRIDSAELELALFSLFLFLWLQFLFFKDTLLSAGPRFLWQNIPSPILSQYFPSLSLFHSFILVGLLPLLAGIFIIYRSLFREKNRHIFLLFSLALSTILFSLLNFVESRTTLVFLALLPALLFSQFYKLFSQYFQQTKLAKYKLPSLIALILLLFLTSVYPSFSLASEQSTPSPEEIQAFLWLKENTLPDAITLAALKEGHLITYLSQRKNFMDDQFSLIEDIGTRFADLNSFFVTQYQTQAIALFSQHQISYLFFSPQAKKEYKLDQLAYLDEKCFELVYSNVVQIYKIKCQLQPTR